MTSTRPRPRPEVSAVRPGSGRVRPLAGGWWLDALLLGAFVLVTVALLARTPLLRLDVAVDRWCDTHRPYAGYLVARGLNYAGQGSPLTLLTVGLGVYLGLRRHTVRPVLVGLAAFALTYLTIGPLKVLTDRAAPSDRTLAHPEYLFANPPGMSYPSGHVGNAIVWYVALTILFGAALPMRVRVRWWVWRWCLWLVPPVLVTVTTTYLGWHWITDDIAGALLGVVLARLLLRIRWDHLPLGRRLESTGWAGPAGLSPDEPSPRPGEPGRLGELGCGG